MVSSRPMGLLLLPSELICSSVPTPMQFRVLYDDAYQHTQTVLGFCNKLGFRDATAEVKPLVMFADAVLQEEDFSQAYEIAMWMAELSWNSEALEAHWMVKTTKLRKLSKCTGFPARSTTRIWQPQSSSDVSSNSAPLKSFMITLTAASSLQKSTSDVSTSHHQTCIASWLYLTLSGPCSESQQFPHILILLRSRTETIREPPMKLAFFNFKFGTKWIDYWLRLENLRKGETLRNVLLQFYYKFIQYPLP